MDVSGHRDGAGSAWAAVGLPCSAPRALIVSPVVLNPIVCAAGTEGGFAYCSALPALGEEAVHAQILSGAVLVFVTLPPAQGRGDEGQLGASLGKGEPLAPKVCTQAPMDRLPSVNSSTSRTAGG